MDAIHVDSENIATAADLMTSVTYILDGLSGCPTEVEDAIRKGKEKRIKGEKKVDQLKKDIAFYEKRVRDEQDRLSSLSDRLASLRHAARYEDNDYSGPIAETLSEINACRERVFASQAELGKTKRTLDETKAIVQSLRSTLHDLEEVKSTLSSCLSQLSILCSKGAYGLSSLLQYADQYLAAPIGAEVEFREYPFPISPLELFLSRGERQYLRPSQTALPQHEVVRPSDWRSFRPKETNASFEEDLRWTNPHFYRDPLYQNNCQRCVPSYELRRRGQDVEALPSDSDLFLAKNPFAMWQNPQITRVRRGSGYAEILNVLRDAPEGARFQVVISWEKFLKGGHTFVAEKRSGRIIFVDPQSGESGAVVEEFFSRAKSGETRFCRIDQLSVNELIYQCCKNKGD